MLRQTAQEVCIKIPDVTGELLRRGNALRG